MFKNKQYLLFFLVCIGFLNIGFSSNEETNKFKLIGVLTGLKNGSKVYLVQYSTMDTIGVSDICNGKFSFTGKVPLGTEYYFIRIDSSIKRTKSQEFLLINGTQWIEGAIESWPAVLLKGSAPNDELNEAKELWNHESEPKERILKIKEYIFAHPNSIYIPDLIRRLRSEFDFSTLEMMCSALSASSKESYFGGLLLEDLDSIRKRNKIREGCIIPDFEIVDSLGKSFNLSEIAPNSKYTLIDFWASWCAPCREEFSNLRKAHLEFGSRGLNIISIALSDKERDWKKAIQEEKCPWFQGRDALNKSYKIFDIPAIPAFILIDSSGKIVSFDCQGSKVKNFGPPIRGEELFTTIDSLLLKDKNSSQIYSPIKVGSIVPGNVSLGKVINHNMFDSATVGDFRGKLLILDFWSIYCATCIYSFPHQKKLQDRFSDDVIILPVGFDGNKKGSIQNFVQHSIGTYFELRLPTAIQKSSDSVLMKLFPFGSLPHLVWISKTGELLGITDNRALTEENISELLKGHKLKFKEANIKKRWLPHEEDVLLKRNETDAVIGGSAFAKYNDEYTHISNMFSPTDGVGNFRWYFLNYTLFDLYKAAYVNVLPQLEGDAQNKYFVLEGKNPSASLLDWKDVGGMDNWEFDKFSNDYLFCYELIMPGSLNNNVVNIQMEKDLDNFFQVESKVSLREVNCIKVIRKNNTINDNLIKNRKEYKYASGSELVLCLNRNFWFNYPLLAEGLTKVTSPIFLIPHKSKLNKQELEFVMEINSIMWQVEKEKLKVLVLKGKADPLK